MRIGMRVGLAGVVLTGVALAGVLTACTSSEAPAGAATSQTSMANSCIKPAEIARQEIVSDQEIRFKMRNGETWVNTLPHACPSLKFEQAFSWDVHGSLVCSNQQTIRVKNVGACQLGAFTRLPPAAQGS